ncbi:MAG: 5'-3' exonuclease, partial [Miltoncostaeaceae bacterium]
MSDDRAAGEGRLLLVDGNSLAYRAFFALPDTIATDQGFPTNALYGLASMMVRVLADQRPGRCVVAWDAPGKVFRHEVYPEYKAGRRETPDLLREQQPRFKPLMEAFGFANVDAPGFEADDVIGTLAEQAHEAGEEVLILTGDRDSFQLVRDGVSVLATGRGVTDTTEYTPDAVRQRYGVGPELMVDFRGLVGDSSDNLPGVPGIGEKGAAKLIDQYGDLEGVLAHAEDQTPKRRERLIEHADDARLTRDMAVIKRDLELGDFELSDVEPLDFGPDRLGALHELFHELQFATLAERLSELGEAPVRQEAAPAVAVEVAATEMAPEEIALRAAGADRLAVA